MFIYNYSFIIMNSLVMRRVLLKCVPTGHCDDNKVHKVPTDTAFYGHFRLKCNKKCKKNTVHDFTLQRYREQVSTRVMRVLTTLHLV